MFSSTVIVLTIAAAIVVVASRQAYRSAPQEDIAVYIFCMGLVVFGSLTAGAVIQDLDHKSRQTPSPRIEAALEGYQESREATHPDEG